ncbi:Hypothetical protein NTJ_00527 [Nesidiocoris tenuis]|nr:Hypothetical protein NTJ_00527 [Nesidiocoris tenuis]
MYRLRFGNERGEVCFGDSFVYDADRLSRRVRLDWTAGRKDRAPGRWIRRVACAIRCSEGEGVRRRRDPRQLQPLVGTDGWGWDGARRGREEGGTPPEPGRNTDISQLAASRE